MDYLIFPIATTVRTILQCEGDLAVLEGRRGWREIYVKSIEDGLLDFPAQRYGEEIWLCWKAGEDGVKFWHEKDSGFGGRKPLEINDESLV